MTLAYIVSVAGDEVQCRPEPAWERRTYTRVDGDLQAGTIAQVEIVDNLISGDSMAPAEILHGLAWRQGPKEYVSNGVHLNGTALLGVHVADPRVAELAGHHLELLLVEKDARRTETNWLHLGGLEGWLTDCGIGAIALAIERRSSEVEEIRARSGGSAIFVNPYTFVPLPEKVWRARPAYHDCLPKDRFGVRFQVTLVATTPLLIRSGPRDAVVFPGQPKRRVLPGSTLKGALRSLHETLTGSCMRVFDGDFLPVYRDQAVSRPDGWEPMIVTAAEDGKPTEVKICSRHVWAEASIVHGAIPAADLRTGQLVDVDVANTYRGIGYDNRIHVGSGGVTAGSGWVVIVSNVRPPPIGGIDPAFNLALGELSNTTATVSSDIWDRYLAAVKGSDDVRCAAAAIAVDTTVIFKDNSIGFRQAASEMCAQGDVFWGTVVGGEVTNMALAMIWRTKGKYPARMRVPGATLLVGDATDHATNGDEDDVARAALPCTNEIYLCPSCRLFGSAGADDKSDEQRKAEQHSYRGHVRIGDARADGDVKIVDHVLPPMGAPRPGAGQFYLRQNPESPARGGQYQAPVRQWGSAGDTPEVRHLAGRKYYWQADPNVQQDKRHRRRDGARAHQKGEGMPPVNVEVVEAGGSFVVDIVAEGLDKVQLGALVATFEPHRVLADHVPEGWAPLENQERSGIALRVGGGKPLGLGTVQATIGPVEVWTAASRYAGEKAPEADIDGWVQVFVNQVPDEVKAAWPHLAAALRIGHVNPASVWYPPRGPWTLPDSQFEASAGNDFPVFWRNSSGSYAAHSDLLALPEGQAIDQYLPIRGKK